MSWNDLIGRRLDRYVIVDELGRGGSSRVYRAHDTATEQDVAIKVIPNDAEDRVGFVRRFDREVEVVRQLSHPNIVAVQDRGETDDLVYLVMQLVGGGTLRARMGKPLPIIEACAAIVQMAHALHHAHVRGIVHRDVKPSNMLVNAEDARHLLLTDFGIAKIQGHRGLTKSGTTVGTPEYMSPEQAEGKETDPRSDVYSLGCVLYEGLAGRPPFVGATPVSVLYQQVHARPSYLRTFNSDVPRDLGRIIEQALAKRPEERFGTALHFAEALRPFAAGGMPPIELPVEPAARVTPLPEPYAPVPSFGAGWDGPSDATTALTGLGVEGLDALFPDDAVAPPPLPSSPADVPAAEAQPSPPVARSKHTIPLNQFRLPSKATMPLDLPLTTDGRLDIEALMARVEAQGAASGGAPATWDAPVQASMNTVTPPSWAAPPSNWGTAAARGGATGGPANLPVAAPRSMPGWAPRSQPQAVWRPPAEEVAAVPPRARRRRSLPSGRMIGGVAAAVFLFASLGVWLAVSASALGTLANNRGGHHTATATRTATPSPPPTASPTQVPSPTISASPTTDPQVALDREAAASFRGVTLASFHDASCATANAKTQFTTAETIYINLCASGAALNVPTAITIRQGGAVLYTLANGTYIGPNQTFFVYRYGISPGTYDAVVTQTIDGKEATAADIRFTVG